MMTTRHTVKCPHCFGNGGPINPQRLKTLCSWCFGTGVVSKETQVEFTRRTAREIRESSVRIV